MLNFVSHFPTDRPWSLLFHAHGYGLSNMMPLSVAIAMGKVVQENKSLQKIYIVQGSWFMNFVCQCIFPFLSKEMREKFILIEGSLLEVTSKLREEGFNLSDLIQMRDNFGKIEG